MSATKLERVLRRALADLAASNVDFALVGGLAVSARAEPRFTRDLDVAVAIENDAEAESLVQRLSASGYNVVATVEQEATARLATVRLVPPGESAGGVIVDLLFASSGVEVEIVRDAEPLEILEGLEVKVATVGYLIATKVLSRDDRQRPQDHADLLALLKNKSKADIDIARKALQLVHERGFNRQKDLAAELERLLSSQ